MWNSGMLIKNKAKITSRVDCVNTAGWTQMDYFSNTNFSSTMFRQYVLNLRDSIN